MAEIIDVIMRLKDETTNSLRRIRNGMEQTAKAHMKLGRDITNAGRGIGNIAHAMAPLAAGIAGVGAISAKTFMDFDATITGAAVKAGATAEEMQKMKDSAAAMGAKFPTTARDVAAGMDRLAAGGFNAEQSIGAMPGIIESAIASGEDLVTTSDVITSALSIWNLTQGDVAANTTHVADVVQAAANASKLGMQDFGVAMQYAGAPAAALGINIEELGTAMAIMSNNGIEASTIGTSIRSTLSRLADPPKAAAMALDQLGISMADLQKGDGSFIGLSGAVSLLRDKMSGMTDVQQVAMAKAIAGQEAYSGLLALIKTAPGDYQAMTNTITNSAGSSHAAYLRMQDTLKGSIDAMKSSIEALAISFGSALAPSIRRAAGAIKWVADIFTTMSPNTRQMIINIGAGVIAFTGLAFAVSKVTLAAGSLVSTYGMISRVMAGKHIRNKALEFGVQRAIKGFGLMKAAASAMMGPMGLVVAGIALAAILIYKNWDKIGPFFVRIWSIVKSSFAGAIELIRPAVLKLQLVWMNLVNAWNNGTGVIGLVKGNLQFLAGLLGGVLTGAIIVASSAITGVLTGAFRIITAVVSSAIGVFGGIIEFITGVFTGNWTLAWQGVYDIFSNIFGGITGVCEGVLEGIKSAINGVISGINGISVDIPEWVPKFGGSHFSLNIPYLAHGTDNWPGGPAIIGERGAEFVDLPKGSSVASHDRSLQQAYAMGANANRGDGITVNINGAVISGADDIKALARKVAEEIQEQMEKVAINSTVGAI